MKFKRKEAQTALRVLPRVLVCLLTVAGCATHGTHQHPQTDHAAAGVQERQVRPGDTASVRYLCRLRSGEVVAATDSLAAGQRISNLFVEREEIGPLSITAVSAADAPQAAPFEQRSLEDEITSQLAPAISGMKEGESRSTELKAGNAPAGEAHKYIARLARVRTRPKVMKMPKGDYEYRTHKSPQVGEAFSLEPEFPGKVESVSDSDVTIRFFATPGAGIETPFGPGRIREEGEDYKMDIEAHKGALVRIDAMVGRISDVNDKVITIDFGNPFGGETLLCDVTVEKIADDAKSARSGE